jgi:hypothetical protein
MRSRRSFIPLAIALSVPVVAAGLGPVPPCSPGDPISEPAFAAVGAPPAVAISRRVALGADDCFGGFDEPMDLVIALSGRFRNAGGVEKIAERAGAISAMIGMRYWSVTDGDWRELVSAAYAVADPDNRVQRVTGDGLHGLLCGSQGEHGDRSMRPKIAATPSNLDGRVFQ